MQTLLKSLLAFVHSDAKNALSQSLRVQQHDDRTTDVSGKLTEIYGAARKRAPPINRLQMRLVLLVVLLGAIYAAPNRRLGEETLL